MRSNFLKYPPVAKGYYGYLENALRLALYKEPNEVYYQVICRLWRQSRSTVYDPEPLWDATKKIKNIGVRELAQAILLDHDKFMRFHLERD